MDIGAGTGRYSVALSNEGYQVDAIELVKYNLGVLKAKKSNVKAYQGTALDLSRYQDNTLTSPYYLDLCTTYLVMKIN